MKKIIILLMIATSFLFGKSGTETILKEIKELRVDLGVKIEQNKKLIEQNSQKIDQNGKKIEQNAIRIEQMDKRLDFMQNLLYIILAAVIGLPLYLDSRTRREDQQLKDKVKDITVALRELSQDDPKIKRSLEVAGLL